MPFSVGNDKILAFKRKKGKTMAGKFKSRRPMTVSEYNRSTSSFMYKGKECVSVFGKIYPNNAIRNLLLSIGAIVPDQKKQD